MRFLFLTTGKGESPRGNGEHHSRERTKTLLGGQRRGEKNTGHQRHESISRGNERQRERSETEKEIKEESVNREEGSRRQRRTREKPED